MEYVNIHSPFSISLLTSDFSAVLKVFLRFFTWSALGDVDLRFSLIWWQKPMVLKGELHQTCNYTTNVIIQTRDLWRDSDITVCYPPTQDKCGQESLCEITLKRKISHVVYAQSRLTRGVNFQIALERNRVKRDLSVFIMHFLLYFAILYW
jgi:hypothetical protein